MTIDEQLNQLASQSCPKQVDVVDRVMKQVEQHPYLQPKHTQHRPSWRRVSILVAAAAVALVAVNVVFFSTQSTSPATQHSSALPGTPQYSFTPVEQAAVESDTTELR